MASWHFGPQYSLFIEENRPDTEVIPVNRFIYQLDQVGLEGREHNGRLCITYWGQENSPPVFEEYGPNRFRRVREGLDYELGYSFIVTLDDRHVRIQWEDEVKNGEITYTPTLVYGRPPKFAVAEVLEKLGYEAKHIRLPEVAVKVPGHYWPDADVYIAHPDTVDVACFASEASKMLEWYLSNDRDYRNADEAYSTARQVHARKFNLVH